ncbi:MAG: exosortase-dependent surface protein XDP2 [Cyanobacteria bacterium P01_A01_bin.105]
MNIKKVTAYLALATGGWLLSAPAQAFTFETNYDAALTGADQAKGDILLESVKLEDGTVLSDFTLVTDARIKYNDVFVGDNSGAASSDIGDLATTGVQVEDAGPADIVNVLNNNNLNNIIDTEDAGTAEIDLFFEQAVDNIFLWERGMNSRMDLQAIDTDGNAIGTLIALSNSSEWSNAGFSIDTKEIGNAQQVGSIGINFSEFDVAGPISGIRVISGGALYNGPDWKLMGSVADVDVPEPSSLLGLLAAGGAMLTARRRQNAVEA